MYIFWSFLHLLSSFDRYIGIFSSEPNFVPISKLVSSTSVFPKEAVNRQVRLNPLKIHILGRIMKSSMCIHNWLLERDEGAYQDIGVSTRASDKPHSFFVRFSILLNFYSGLSTLISPMYTIKVHVHTVYHYVGAWDPDTLLNC